MATTCCGGPNAGLRFKIASESAIPPKFPAPYKRDPAYPTLTSGARVCDIEGAAAMFPVTRHVTVAVLDPSSPQARSASRRVTRVKGPNGGRRRGIAASHDNINRVQFEEVAGRVAGLLLMTPAFGRRIYTHTAERSRSGCWSSGAEHAASAAYIAAALEANDCGHLATIDHGGAQYHPSPEEMLARVGLAHQVTVAREHDFYGWFLKLQIERNSDADGNCSPMYDFVFFDGSHSSDIDGLAIVLIGNLLRPGSWMLLGDLDWTYEHNPWVAREPVAGWRRASVRSVVGGSRKRAPDRAVVELIVKQHPSFTHFIREDECAGGRKNNRASHADTS